MADTICIATKACRECGVLQPVVDFPPYSNGRGYRPMCRACFNKRENELRKARREFDPEWRAKQNEKNKTYWEKHPDGYKKHQLKKREKQKSSYFSNLRYRCRQLAISCQRRAKQKGLECEVTTDILYVLIHAQNFKCVVTGTKLEIGASKKYFRNPRAPSIDRRDSDHGYTLDNIQIVAAWYNMMKNEWSDEDLREFIHTAYHTLFPSED